jgi:putative transposase
METQAPKRLSVDKISVGETVLDVPVAHGRDLIDFEEEEWLQAQRRYEVIKPLIQDAYRKRIQVEAAAEAAGVHAVTVYEWIKLFEQTGHLSALVPRKRGRKKGTKLLERAVETIIEVTIGDTFLAGKPARPQIVVDEVKRRCKIAGLPAPHPNSVRNRVRELGAATVLRRRGRKDKARNLYQPIRGTFPGADFPLAVVQIDHTEADIIVVEEESRLPMGRPWMTLAIDVFSRMVVGCYISMEHPSAVAAGLCLARAMVPKGEYLAALDVPGDWPVWGKPVKVHADNAREFRGNVLKRACEQYSIDLQMRPVKVPHYGGHIERLMGTSANEVRKLPGATFSSPAERKGYDSEKASALTFSEFERYLVDFIVNVYHRRLHSELEMPPFRKWEIGLLGDGSDLAPVPGLPEIPLDPIRLKLDFMPFVMRTVQPYGIVIDDVFYYHEVLNRWINSIEPGEGSKKREFVVRRDPADISVVHFYDPEAQQYFAIPYRNPAHPAITLWELRDARRRVREEGKRHVDEDTIFAAAERMRSRVEESVAKTKAARRMKHRIAISVQQGQAASLKPPLRQVPTSANDSEVVAAQSAILVDDIFSEPVEPFDDLGGMT